MIRNRESGEFERYFGMRKVPNGSKGDQELDALLRASKADFAKLKVTDVPGIIDADARTPWQQIVGILDQLQQAGIDKLQFAASNLDAAEKR